MANEIGRVSHWYNKLGVAVVKLSDDLKIGDRIKIMTTSGEFEDEVFSMQIDYTTVKSATAGSEVAIKLSQKAKEGSVIQLAE